MREFFSPETQIYYRTNDLKPGRPSLLFVHGMSGCAAAWEKYEAKFSNQYNVVSLDLRGHGKSGKQKKYADYRLTKFAADLIWLIKKLELNHIILISHSFGTLVAFEFLKTHEKLISAAIFLSPNLNVNNRLAAQIIKPFLALVPWLEKLPFPLTTGRHIIYQKYLHTGDWNLRRSLADIKNTSLRVYLYCTRQAYSGSYEQVLKHIKIPCLIIHGQKDSIFPVSNAHYLKKYVSQAQLKILPQADHILVLNYFPEVSTAIEKFIRQLPNA